MNQNSPSDWKHNPWAIGLSVVLCAPFGLFLLWKHPTWTSKTKWIATAVYIAVGIIGAICDPGENKKHPIGQTPVESVDSTSLQSETPPPTRSKVKKSARSGYELGNEFRLGDYKYTILSVETQYQIGKEIFGNFMGERAGTGATFVIVTYTIENCTSESQTVLSDDFKLVDAKGRKFQTSSKVSTALLMHTDDKDFLLSQLQPGIPRQMQQGFELPEKSVESDLTLIVPKKGIFSRGEARIIVNTR